MDRTGHPESDVVLKDVHVHSETTHRHIYCSESIEAMASELQKPFGSISLI